MSGGRTSPPDYSRAVQLIALLLAVGGIVAGIWRYWLATIDGVTAFDSFWLGATTIILGLGAMIAVRLASRGRPQRGAYLFLLLFNLTLLLNAFLGPTSVALLVYLGLPTLAIVFGLGGTRAGAVATVLFGVPALLLLISAGAPVIPFLLSLLGMCVVTWTLLVGQQRAVADARQAQEAAIGQAEAAARQAALAEANAASAVRVAEDALRRAAALARAGEAVERAVSEGVARERDLSERLASAFEEIHSLEQLSERQRRNLPVERLTAAMAGARTPAMIAGRASRVFVQQLGLARCDVYRRPAEDADSVVLVASHSSATAAEHISPGADARVGAVVALAESPVWRSVLDTGQAQVGVPPHSTTVDSATRNDGEGIEALTLPLTAGVKDKAIGLVVLYRLGNGPAFAPEEQATARAMAARLAFALQLVGRAGEARRMSARAALLGRMTDIALAAPDELALFRWARRELFTLFNATAFGVLLWQPERAGLEWTYAHVGGELELRMPRPVAGEMLARAARDGRALRRAELGGRPMDDTVGGLTGRAAACRLAVPLADGGVASTGGMLLLEHESDPQALSEEDLEWLSALAGPLAAGIHNKRLTAELRASLVAQSRQQEQLIAAAEHAAGEHERRLAESDERVRQQQLVNEVSARLHRAADVDGILGLGMQALSVHLGGRAVEVHLGETVTTEAGAPALDEHWSLPGQSVHALYIEGKLTVHRGPRTGEPARLAGQSYPLSAGADSLGDVLIAGGGSLSPADEELIQALLREMAAALQNARHIQVAQARASQLQAAVDVSRAISGYLDYEALTSQVAHLIRRRFGFHFVALFVVAGDEAQMLSGDGEPLEGLPTPFTLPLTEGSLLGRAASGNTPQPGQGDDAGDPLPPPFSETRSRLALPLRARSALQGLLDIHSRRENAFGPDEIAVLQGLAGQVAVALDNAQLFMRLQESYLANARLVDETREHLAELRLLFAVSQAATSSADIGQRLHFIVSTLHHGLRGATIAIHGIALSDAGLLLLATEGDLPQASPAELSTVLHGGPAPPGPKLIAVRAEPAQAEEAESGESDRTRLLVPLRLGDNVVGLLAAYHAHPETFSRREMRLLETLGPSLAATIETGRIIAGIEAANERLRELDSLRNRFLANMSHELRTPLNAIIGFARVMLKGIDGSLNELQGEDLRAIEQNAQHLLLLINDVLDMAKIEAGRIELFPEEVDVGTLAAGLAATVRGLLVGKPVSFELDVAPDLPPMQADATRLRQILLNLLSNAARYTEKGSIECRLSRPDPDHLLIEVQDTGVGIPADEQATLWQPFVQTASGLRAGQGTGLGLPITRHLVELHGGEIWFESVEGAGSTFLVRLPLRR